MSPRAHRCPATVLLLLLPACLKPYEARHDGQWDARDQIWVAEASQVRLRAAQSRLFDVTDRQQILAAVIATMQDLGFMIEELDEQLGIVYGQRFDPLEAEAMYDPTYHLYDQRALLLFTRTYQGWGPFDHRSNLVRLTVTVRRRNQQQSVVRASAQFYLRAVEDPEAYQRFFQAVEQKLAHQAKLLDAAGG